MPAKRVLSGEIIAYIEKNKLLSLVQWDGDVSKSRGSSFNEQTQLSIPPLRMHNRGSTQTSVDQLIDHIYTLERSCRLGVPIDYRLQYFQQCKELSVVGQRSRLFCGFVVSGVVSMGVYRLYRPMIDPVLLRIHTICTPLWLQGYIGGRGLGITDNQLQLIGDSWRDCIGVLTGWLETLGLMCFPQSLPDLQQLYVVYAEWVRTSMVNFSSMLSQ